MDGFWVGLGLAGIGTGAVWIGVGRCEMGGWKGVGRVCVDQVSPGGVACDWVTGWKGFCAALFRAWLFRARLSGYLLSFTHMYPIHILIV